MALIRKLCDTPLDRAVRGIIIAAASDSEQVQRADIPIVSVDRRFGSYPLVATDNFEGSGKIAEHLFNLGHRRMAYIAGPQSMEVARQRHEGFVAKIKSLSTRGDPISLSVHEGHFHYDSGEDIGRTILTGKPSEKRPTAIAAASDQQAIGVLRCARDLKIEIPEELSVAGFDDIALASLVVPRLTTLRQPIEQLAKIAVERIFAINNTLYDEREAGKVIARESTATV